MDSAERPDTVERVGQPRVGKPPGPPTGDMFRDGAFGWVPETVDQFQQLNREVWHSDAVRPALLEILRLRNAKAVNCVYCRSVRFDAARQDGLTEDRVEQITDTYQQSALSEPEKLAIAFADVYLRDPGGMAPELRDRLQAMFSARQLAQMAVALAAFNTMSRTAVSMGGMRRNMPPITEVKIPR